MTERRRLTVRELYDQRLRAQERALHERKMQSADDRLEEQVKKLESARRLYEERLGGNR